MRFFVWWLTNVVALIIVSGVFPGVRIDNISSALFAALVIGLFNMVVRPLLIIVTLPINILTLGLFTFVVNGIIFYSVSKIVNGFSVSGFWSAVFGAILFSAVNVSLNFIFKPKKAIRTNMFFREGPGDNELRRNSIDVEIIDPEKDREKGKE